MSKTRSLFKPGSEHPRSKFSDDQVRLMRRRRAAGWTIKRLSEKYGVCEGAISKIVSGKAYPNVPLETDPLPIGYKAVTPPQCRPGFKRPRGKPTLLFYIPGLEWWNEEERKHLPRGRT